LAVTYTFGNMQSRVAGDLRRTNLATQINDKIIEACEHFQDDAFWDNEEIAISIPSVASQQAYPLPVDFSKLIGPIRVTYNGVTVPLEVITLDELRELDSNASIPLDGVPTRYNLFNNTFVTWPRPDKDTYLFDLDYVSNLAPPVNQSDTGFWMNQARHLIAHYAMGLIWKSVIRDQQKAADEFELANSEYRRIQATSESRAYDAGKRVWPV
jgi:hypothetical protein